MRIDVHTHYRTPEYLEAMERLGAFEKLSAYRILRTQIRPLVGVISDDEHVASRLEDMESAGIDMQMLCIGAYQPYFRETATAVEAARITNDMHLSLVQRHPDRFDLFACLPLPHLDKSLAELERCLDDLGCAGINLGCSAGGRPLDAPELDEVWAELDRRRAVVFIHPGTEDQVIIGSQEFHLAPDFGAAAEIAVTIARLVVTGHRARYPNVQIIAGMTGGSLPQMLHRYEKGLRQSNPELAESLGGVTPHLKQLYYDTCMMEEPAILEAAASRFGADRLLLGSDYGRPFVTSETGVAYIQSSDALTDDEKSAVLDGTAAALLGRALAQPALGGLTDASR